MTQQHLILTLHSQLCSCPGVWTPSLAAATASLAPAALAPMGASHAQLSQGDLLTKNCPFSQGPGRMPTTCLLSGVSG